MRNLDDIKVIEKIDQMQMRNLLKGLAQQCKQAYQLGKGLAFPKELANFKNIVFSGMGGSAIGAEIVSDYLKNEINLPLCVNRDYTLPEYVDRESLVVFISYSGNTEETLSAYQEAVQRQAKILVLTSGGLLADLAKEAGHPYLIIPGGFPPRAALAFLSLPLLAIFLQMRLIKDKENELEETISFLERLEKDSLGISVKTPSNPAKKLAQRIFNNFCVIYAAGARLAGVVSRFRGQLAENSKTLASAHLFPEMNHNEIVGWLNPEEILKRFVVVILRDRAEHSQVKKRIEISKEIWQKEKVAVEEVFSEGNSLLARIFSLIYVGDFTSFYLAILNDEDPTPVKRIDYLKQRLKENK